MSDEEKKGKPPGPPLMRSAGISLGRVFGIPVIVDFSWLLIFFLITLTISQQFVVKHPSWTPTQHWIAGVLTSLLFFFCVFLHEMSHSLVARAFGIPVLSITLFIFGGVSQMKDEPRKAGHEFLIAVAGPLMSVVLSVIFFALAGGPKAIGAENLPMLQSICLWLSGINLTLAVFNMIPGFPLDGGRVFRSLVWALSGRFELATGIAAAAGSFIAYFFIALGIYLVLYHERFIDGVWIAFIGWFLLTAARGSAAQVMTRRALMGLKVADILEQTPPRVSPAMTVQNLVDETVLKHGVTTFFVEDDGVLRGLVTLHQIKSVPREEWPNTPVQSIMVPASEIVVVEPDVPLLHAMETMDTRGIRQMPVVDGDHILGMVTREGMLRVLRAQMIFGGRREKQA